MYSILFWIGNNRFLCIRNCYQAHYCSPRVNLGRFRFHNSVKSVNFRFAFTILVRFYLVITRTFLCCSVLHRYHNILGWSTFCFSRAYPIVVSESISSLKLRFFDCLLLLRYNLWCTAVFSKLCLSWRSFIAYHGSNHRANCCRHGRRRTRRFPSINRVQFKVIRSETYTVWHRLYNHFHPTSECCRYISLSETCRSRGNRR